MGILSLSANDRKPTLSRLSRLHDCALFANTARFRGNPFWLNLFLGDSGEETCTHAGQVNRESGDRCMRFTYQSVFKSEHSLSPRVDKTFLLARRNDLTSKSRYSTNSERASLPSLPTNSL